MNNELRSRALELRRRGASLHVIRHELGVGMAGVQELLRGVAIGADPSKAHPRIEEMAELRLQKFTVSQIAATLKMPASEVIEALEDVGLRRKRADLLSRADEICALFDSGMRAVQIAKKLGLHPPSVQSILKRAGRRRLIRDEFVEAEARQNISRAEREFAQLMGGARYEDAHEAAWAPHRWRSRASGPGITCAAALMVDAR